MIIDGYIAKEDLEKLIYRKLKYLGLSINDYPINSEYIAKEIEHLYIEKNRFTSISIGGILYKGKTKESSAICLNSRRSKKGRNFDCMHELIHFWFHPPDSHFCFNLSYIQQDSAREWQANNGASYALMPKTLFKQKYKEYDGDIKKISNFFNVGELAVKYRMKNLELDLPDYYCSNCKNNKFNTGLYCMICGKELTYGNKRKGVNNMTYEGPITDEDGRVTTCPVCKNDEIEENAEYCKICGYPVVNRCTNEGFDNGNSYDYMPPCDTALPGNARFCYKCGAKSTFFSKGILEDWKVELHTKHGSKTSKEIAATKLPSLNGIDDNDLPF